MITYMSDPSSSATYSDSLSINSQQMNNNCSENRACGALNFTQLQQDIPSNLGDRRDGRNDLLLTQPVQSTSTIHGGPSLEGEGLSLSLGTQIQQGMGNSSMQSGNLNPGLSSFLDKHPSISMEGHTRSVFFGQDGISLDNVGNLSPLTMASTVRTIPNAKYLKAAHQLLEEVVNVQDAVKQPGSSKEVNYEFRTKDGKDTAGDEISDRGHTNSLEAAGKSVNEPSPSERHDLQQKLTKLFSMLDEVDRRYKQYYHQMQIVISSFDAIAGDGAAKSYTAIALQTISRYFRCLRDAITSQIQAARRSHWEQDTLASSNGIKISRLRYVDPKLRQKNALQHCGIVEQNEWRAQRGLPENSVSLLRAWLFEHFLHPYPTDADKILLARQTGLSRSQVSNWFINARVRLWKPMVEEMYKQEKANAETNSSSSHEIATTSSPGDDKASKDKHKQEKDLHQSMRSDYISDVEMNGITGLSDYGYRSVQSNKRDGERFSETSESVCKIQRRFGSTDGVSLTLGLQQCEGGSFPPSNDSIDDPLAPTMESEAEEFEQHRLVS